jgi:hypothetical protein
MRQQMNRERIPIPQDRNALRAPRADETTIRDTDVQSNLGHVGEVAVDRILDDPLAAPSRRYIRLSSHEFTDW